MNTGRFKNSISYYKNGQLQSKAKFKDNQLNGEYIRYHLEVHEDALQQKKYFKNGVLEGPYRSYFSVGESMVEYVRQIMLMIRLLRNLSSIIAMEVFLKKAPIVKGNSNRKNSTI